MELYYLEVALLLIAIYFAKQDYNNGRISWAMFWAFMVGWDLHTLIGMI
jgi:hypothetical protein